MRKPLLILLSILLIVILLFICNLIYIDIKMEHLLKLQHHLYSHNSIEIFAVNELIRFYSSLKQELLFYGRCLFIFTIITLIPFIYFTKQESNV